MLSVASLARGFFILLGGLSFAQIIWRGLALTLGPTVQRLLDLHQSLFDLFFDQIEPLAIWVAEHAFDFMHIDLNDHWSQFVTLTWMYIGADAKNAWIGTWPGAKTTAAVRSAIGLPLALAAGVGTGLLDAASMWIAASILLGFVGYRVGYALRYAYERKNEGFNYASELLEKLMIPLGFAVVGGAIIALVSLLDVKALLGEQSSPPIIAFFALLFGLIAFHMAFGAANAERTRKHDETWLKSFRRQGNTRLSTAMAWSVVSGGGLTGVGALGV